MPTTTEPIAGQSVAITRRLPVGAQCQAGGVHFRVWAPQVRQVEVVLVDPDAGRAGRRIGLQTENDGYYAGFVPGIGAGALYGFSLDKSEKLFPDPASRFQPEGPHGLSQVVDPSAFSWTDDRWLGLEMRGQVFYELHVGTFTPQGTWQAAAEQLAQLGDLGITTIELMPIADFPGKFGWGYDGVNLFAPSRLYGTPDDFRSFVDRAHAIGIGVLLDVVYNHFGPDGNYLGEFSTHYLTDKANDWGRTINFDGEQSAAVREFFIANAAYWIDEFHLDGLRLDATQDIHDASETHLIAEIGRAVRAAAGKRRTIIVAENEPQDARLVQSTEKGGFGLDGLWNDDFHHAAQVALTGRSEAYLTDYHGQPQEFISAAKYGFLYQGQHYRWQGKPRGTPSHRLPPETFLVYLENHDQIANTGRGQRCHQVSSPGRYRALTALLLLGPNTPLLFQGQEFSSSKPFLYFADHGAELAQMVRTGRAKFLSQFPRLATPAMQALLADPAEPNTFERGKLDFCERETHAASYALHRDLLRLRRTESAFQAQRAGGVDGAVLGAEAFVLRFFAEDDADRLLVINLGPNLHLREAPEPLLAPPWGKHWEIAWSSEDPRYGGGGIAPLLRDGLWHLPGQAALVLQPLANPPPAEDKHQRG